MINRKEFLSEIKNTVRQYDAAAEVILFGSRARGDNREDSDWDVLVLTSHELSHQAKDELRDKIYGVEVKYLQDVSLIITDRKYYEYWEIKPLFKNVAKEGITL